MTSDEALHKGYCKHCAAWGQERGCRCGSWSSLRLPLDQCRLPAEAIERWKGEFGLEGEVKRSESSDSFGDKDHQKPKRGRKAKRYLK